MRKIILFITILFLSSLSIFSQEQEEAEVLTYRISEVTYSIQGCGIRIFGQTTEYALVQAVPIDRKRIFNDEDELNSYIQDLEKKYWNLRMFDAVKIDIIPLGEDTDNPRLVQLNIFVKDSFHLFAIPGPKYDSNTGLIFKLKIKDTNFFGSLNTMSSGIYFLIPTTESDSTHAEFGFDISIDYPFKAGIFDATWLNDLGFSYTFGNAMPEWDYTTGIRLELPFDKTRFIMEFDQSIVNNFSYEGFGDNFYFEEALKFSVPLVITQMDYFGDLRYTPYTSTSVSWDFDGISKENSDLSSPVMTLGHSLSFGRVDWEDNIRTGFTFELNNSYTYNFQRHRFYPYLESNLYGYKQFSLIKDSLWLRNAGIAAAFKGFTFLFNPKNDKYIENDGSDIGWYLRGIRDNQSYAGTEISSLNPTSAVILNLDFPIHIFSTNFSKSFLKYFNFDFQLSPFLDAALCYNKINQTFFSFKDGFYAAGLEVIVYPLRWSGIIVRGSIGIDIGRQLFSNNINTDWREDVSTKEFSVGFGLHY